MWGFDSPDRDSEVYICMCNKTVGVGDEVVGVNSIENGRDRQEVPIAGKVTAVRRRDDLLFVRDRVSNLTVPLAKDNILKLNGARVIIGELEEIEVK